MSRAADAIIERLPDTGEIAAEREVAQLADQVTALTILARTDPEAYHGQRDLVWQNTLTAIRDGHPDPAALAAAALATERIRPAWEACA